MENKKTYTSVEEYLADFPPEISNKLNELRNLIFELVPGVEEKIAYGMPAYRLNGVLFYFAGYVKHIGFYPGASAINYFANELSAYKTSKGTLQLPLHKPLPISLLTELIRFRLKETKD